MRSLVSPLLLLLFAAPVVAQEVVEPAAPAQPRSVGTDTPFGPCRLLRDVPCEPDAAPRWTAWIAYSTAEHDHRDHATYLDDLQKRYRDRRVRIVVALPTGAAAQLAAGAPAVGVAELAVGMEGILCALAPTAEPSAAVVWAGIDGLVDRLDAAIEDRLAATQPGAVDDLITSLLSGVGDGGQYADSVAQVLRVLPRSGAVRALTVLEPWWCRGDLAAARRAIDDGIAALADEAVPLCLFADFALRGDRTDPSIAKALAMALGPAAATAPDGVFTQLVYLRALLMAGQDRLGARVAAALEPKLAGRPQEELWFAETLMEAVDARPHRERAERAIERARRGGVDVRHAFGARHKVLARCGADPAQLDRLIADYRRSEAFNSSLNNDAWYMVTQPPTMGRFDTLALANAEEMLRSEGEGMDAGNRDTVALVLFRNGLIERAVAEQTVAVRARGNDPEYVGRLTRYENALAQARARVSDSAPK